MFVLPFRFKKYKEDGFDKLTLWIIFLCLFLFITIWYIYQLNANNLISDYSKSHQKRIENSRNYKPDFKNCTDDCNWHQAWYDWAEINGATKAFHCKNKNESNSFYEGCIEYLDNPRPGEPNSLSYIFGFIWSIIVFPIIILWFIWPWLILPFLFIHKWWKEKTTKTIDPTK